MGDDEGHVFDAHLGHLQHVLDGRGDNVGGEAIDLATIHVDDVLVVAVVGELGPDDGHRVVVERGQGQQVTAGAVGAQRRGHDPAGHAGAFQHHRPRAVAEEDARAAVAPVKHPRHRLRADDDGIAHRAGGDGLRGHLQGVDEAGAGGAQVKRAGPPRAEVVLHQAGRGREHVARRRSGDDDEIDLRWMQIGHGQGARGGLEGQGGRRLVRGGNVAGADAGALVDPFVRRVYQVGQLVVADGPVGQVAAPADDVGVSHHGWLSLSSSLGK